MARILVISNYRNVHSSRPEAEIFIGLQEAGHEVHIMTFEDAAYNARFIEKGIHLIPFHPVKKFSSYEIRKIRRHLLDEQIDVIFLFNGVSIVNGIQAAKATSAKIVVYRGSASNVHWYDPTAYFKYLHPAVDKIICNSYGVEKYIRKALIWKKDKAITILKGHKLEWYDGIAALPRNLLPCPEGAFIAVCVANDRKVKGIEYLLKSTLYWPEHTSAHLLLIGNIDKKKYTGILTKIAHSDKIHFLGFKEDPLPIVAASDCFILPSIGAESLTKSVIEAMALQVCPIITDIPGNRELVQNGKNGWVIAARDAKALANATLDLASKPEKVKEMSKNARNWIPSHLSHEETVKNYESLLNSLVGK